MQSQYVDLLVDALLDEGFTVEEAQHLIQLQEKYQERYREQRKIREKNHHVFVRWLIDHGKLSEW